MARPKNCRVCRHPKTQCTCGRPTVFTPTVLQKLEDAFANSCTDEEAAIFAGISLRPLYTYQKENPEFKRKKELLKKSVNLSARSTIVRNIGDVRVAQWWAERKMGDEFGVKQKIEHAGKIQTEEVGETAQPEAIKTIVSQFEEALRQTFMRASEPPV